MSEKERIWQYEIASSSTYDFECSSCGECCRGEMLIQLNLLDLSRMIEFLNVETTEYLFEKGIVGEHALTAGGFRPYLVFKGKPFKSCPFLENRLEDDGQFLGLCRLHPNLKPLVCSLAPLGREVEGSSEKWFFTEPIEGCPGCKSKKVCSVVQTIAPHQEDLKLEKMYFSVMDRLQNTDAPIAKYRDFHRELRRGISVYRYLQHWL